MTLYKYLYYYYYFFLTEVNYAMQYKKVKKNRAGMNLTPPPSQNSHAVIIIIITIRN